MDLPLCGPRGRGGPRGPPPRWGPPGGGNFGPPGNGPPSLMSMGGGPPEGWAPPGNHDFRDDPPPLMTDDGPMKPREMSQEKDDRNSKNKSTTPGKDFVFSRLSFLKKEELYMRMPWGLLCQKLWDIWIVTRDSC